MLFNEIIRKPVGFYVYRYGKQGYRKEVCKLFSITPFPNKVKYLSQALNGMMGTYLKNRIRVYQAIRYIIVQQNINFKAPTLLIQTYQTHFTAFFFY